eukprot:3382547-Amphidinium_carterae.1
MTITGPISQYTCWHGRRHSTQFWRTVTIRPMHIVQSTSAERKMSQLSTRGQANCTLDNGRLAQDRQQCINNPLVGSLNFSLECHRDTMASQ